MASKFRAALSVEGIDIRLALDNVRAQLDQDELISPAMRASIDMLILVVSLLTNRFNLNSRNSSKPPASDPNRVKSLRRKSGKKPGGQPGQYITALWRSRFHRAAFDRPTQLAKGRLSRCRLRDAPGGRHRYFPDQLGVPLSTGSIANFNLDVAARIVDSVAADIIRQRLQLGPVLQADDLFILPEHCSKNGQERFVVSNAIFAQSVLREQRGRDEQRVFPRTRVYSKGWKRARVRAAERCEAELGAPCPSGFRHLRIDDLRHTFGRRVRAAGWSNEDRKTCWGTRMATSRPTTAGSR